MSFFFVACSSALSAVFICCIFANVRPCGSSFFNTLALSERCNYSWQQIFHFSFLSNPQGSQDVSAGKVVGSLWPLASIRSRENHFKGRISTKLALSVSLSATSAACKKLAGRQKKIKKIKGSLTHWLLCVLLRERKPGRENQQWDSELTSLGPVNQS